MLIMLALVPLIVLTFLSVIFGNEFMMTPSPETIEEEKTIWLVMEKLAGDLAILSVGGTFAIIVIITGLVIVIGIQVLGSGLSDTTVKVLTIITSYTTLWIVLTLLSMPLLDGIEYFGTFIYTILTLIYVIGMIEKISEGM